MMSRFLPSAPVVLALLGLASTAADAQVSITPTRVMLSPSTRTMDVLVLNPTSSPIVCNARLVFSVLRNDTSGAVRQDTIVSESEKVRSCLDWTRIFPKQFTLEPGEKRIVKLMVTPPANIADGEYFARIDLRATRVKRPTEVAPEDTNAIGVNLGVNIGYSIPIYFRKGALTTSLSMTPQSIEMRNGRPWALIDMAVGGNALYRGTLKARLLRSDGSQVAAKEYPVVAEVGYRYPLELPSLPPGDYTLKVDAVTELPGKANETVVRAPTSTHAFSLRIDEKSGRIASSN